MTTLAAIPERFAIRVGPRSRSVVRLWGARPESAWAEIDDDELRVRFGAFRIRTPLANIASWRIEGPFTWIKAIGVRMSVFGGGDVSFAGAAHGGVRIAVHEPIRWGPFRVPAIYVGADHLEGLAEALRARGIPGIDARRAA